MGAAQFGVPRDMVLWIKSSFGIKNFIETGTNRAETASWASDHFSNVCTIEGFRPLYEAAVEKHRDRRNMTFLFGDSRDQLRATLANFAEPAILWLDAHWCGEHTFGASNECPVIEELQAVNASDLDHFILIDDARLFLAPPPLPHAATQWPDIATVCQLLSTGSRPRYVFVFEDVIFAFPPHAKDKAIEFLQRAVSESGSPNPSPPVQSKLRRGIQKLRKVIST